MLYSFQNVLVARCFKVYGLSRFVFCDNVGDESVKLTRFYVGTQSFFKIVIVLLEPPQQRLEPFLGLLGKQIANSIQCFLACHS